MALLLVFLTGLSLSQQDPLDTLSRFKGLKMGGRALPATLIYWSPDFPHEVYWTSCDHLRPCIKEQITTEQLW